MTAYERSGWRDQRLSERHRDWGFNCPTVDLDFLLCEYHLGVPVALVDYKHHSHHDGRNVNTRHPTYRALSALYDGRGENLPLFISRYWPETWGVEVLAVNTVAKQWLGDLETWVRMTEKQWVTGLYKLRHLVIEERVLRKLRTEYPPNDAGGNATGMPAAMPKAMPTTEVLKAHLDP